MKRIFMATVAAALVAGGVAVAVAAPAGADSVRIAVGDAIDNRDM
ncbi:hypothetical protein [Nonomuraea zeae]|nr:hypothetical protein [Nonomuraea zeae]